MAEAAQRAVRVFDGAVLPVSPSGFKPEKLGEKLLFHLSEDGKYLTVQSLVKGNQFRWVGRPTFNSQIWSRLPELSHDLDKAKFLDYVYNFHYVIKDLDAGTLVPVSAEDAHDLLNGKGTTVPDVYRTAFSG